MMKIIMKISLFTHLFPAAPVSLVNVEQELRESKGKDTLLSLVASLNLGKNTAEYINIAKCHSRKYTVNQDSDH